ncbi:MAG: DUF1552 domain-containing protein [Planctomycetota bacterium]
MKSQMSRRTFLRATGVAVALPLLDGMKLHAADTPGPQGAGVTGRRMLTVCYGLGFHPPSFFPEKVGKDYEPSEYLKVLTDAGLKNDFTVFSGISHPDVIGGHEVGPSFLTAAPWKTGMVFRNSISVDQVLAANMLGTTREPYLNLSTSLNGGGSMNGGLSYTASGVGLPAIGKPSVLYSRLFLSGGGNEVKAQQEKLARGHSVLDAVTEQAKTLRSKVGQVDKDKLDEYFNSIRDLEKKMAATEAWAALPKPKVDAKAPVDLVEPGAIIGRMRMMFDMIHLIFQTDSTRVITLFVQDGNAVPSDIKGLTREHHDLTHHSMLEEKIVMLRLHELAEMAAFRDFLLKMKGTKEGNETLLEKTSILSGSSMGSASHHMSQNLPILLAGGGYQHAGHVLLDSKAPKVEINASGYRKIETGSIDNNHNKPLANLFVSILQRTGMKVDKFADSTGTCAGLDFKA